MARSVREWNGATPDARVPDRVRWRVFNRNGRCCAGAKCGRQLRAGDKFQTDHIIALINGGENREKNLQTLCIDCHPKKTLRDVREHRKVYRMGTKQFRGFGETHRPVPGSRASGIRGRMDGTIEAWPK